MNPQVPNEMRWQDYTTTAVQWLSILGGVAVAIVSGVGGNMEGLATGIGMAVAGLAGGKQGSLLEDTVKKIGGALKKGGAVILLLMLAGCATSHPLLQPASLAAVATVAQPYLVSDCKTIEVYAGYRLDWADVDVKGDPDFKSGFGGIFGGCNQFAKISCMVLAIPGCSPLGDPSCNKVDCKVVSVLKAEVPPTK